VASIAWCLFATAAAAAAPESSREARCSVAGAVGDEPRGTVTLELEGSDWRGWPARCRDLGPYLHAGPPPYDHTTAQQTEVALRATGYFARAACEAGGDGTELICKLTPQPIVRSVGLSGHVPFLLLAEDVRRRIFLRSGALLDEHTPVLERQARRLEDYFTSEGYFASHVNVESGDVPGAEPNQGVHITAEIAAGPTVVLRSLAVEGDDVVAHEELWERLSHPLFLFFGQARFQPAQFKADLESLTHFYQRQGWPEARVRGDYRIDTGAGTADVTLQVTVGPKLIMKFSGNEALDSDTLTRLATFAEAGVFDAVEVESTTHAIVTAFQKKGFFDVRVRSATSARRDLVVLSYVITQGPEADISAVRFAGNHAFDASRLQGELLTRPTSFLVGHHWVDEWVETDLRTLTTTYRNAGYAQARIEASRQLAENGRLEVTFTIDEGPQRQVDTFEVEGLPPEVPAGSLETHLKLRKGEPYVPDRAAADESEILGALAAYGYAQAAVEHQIDDKTLNVTVRYLVRPGPRASFGGLFLRGNFRTRASYLASEVGLVPGQPLDLVALGRARRRLRDLGVFGSIDLRPIGLTPLRADTWMLLAVEESEQRSLDAVLGYATDEHFSVGADYRDNNFLGRAIRLDGLARLSNASEVLFPARIGNRDRLQLGLRLPRPWSLPADLQALASYDFQRQPLFRERRVGATAGLVHTVVDRRDCPRCVGIVTALGYELVSTDYVAFAPSTINPSTTPQGTIARLVPNASFDGRDSFVDPHRGFYADARFEMASRYFAPVEGGASFVRLLLSAQLYVRLATLLREHLEEKGTLGGPLVLALATSYGAAHPWMGTSTMPASETFAYGGDNSVRGIPDRASSVAFPGALQLSVDTVELRWYAWQGAFGVLQLAAFADAGTVAYTFTSLYRNLTLTAGPILRYVLPVGPLSVAYGWPVVRGTDIPAGGRLHISFGYAF
jgi:outer membrane protein insertion porin family